MIYLLVTYYYVVYHCTPVCVCVYMCVCEYVLVGCCLATNLNLINTNWDWWR